MLIMVITILLMLVGSGCSNLTNAHLFQFIEQGDKTVAVKAQRKIAQVLVLADVNSFQTHC